MYRAVYQVFGLSLHDIIYLVCVGANKQGEIGPVLASILCDQWNTKNGTRRCPRVLSLQIIISLTQRYAEGSRLRLPQAAVSEFHGYYCGACATESSDRATRWRSEREGCLVAS